MEKAKVDKKSLTYIRPQMGKFTLESFPGVEFRFRKPNIDDTEWIRDTFDASLEELAAKAPNGAIRLSTLVQIWFHHLEEDSKRHFVPFAEDVMNYDTGETQKVIHPGWRRFMKSISGGEELTKISNAWTLTCLAGKAIEDLPEEVKKNILATLPKDALA